MPPDARPVAIAPYDPDWSARFEAESDLIRLTIGETVEQIHHMGSTSVPGLSAKPVIDIFLRVHTLADLDLKTGLLQVIGYVPYGENGLAGRRFFAKGGTKRSHHVHAYAMANKEPLRHLAFRDYLRLNTPIAQAYAALKKRCAAAHAFDMPGYCDCKESFILEHQSRAMAWFAHQGVDYG